MAYNARLSPGGYPVARKQTTPADTTVPQGWMSESPIILTKKFGAHLQQVTSFEPQGPISITPQGWTSESPQIRFKGFPAHEQQFSGVVTVPVVVTPYLGFAEFPALRVKPFPASQHQSVSFAPQGLIYSIIPQAWTPSPIILAKPFAVWEQFFATEPPEPLVTYPPVFSRDEPVLLRKPFRDFSASVFTPAPNVQVTISFSPSPMVFTRRYSEAQDQATGFEPPSFSYPLGFMSDAMPVKVRYNLDHQATSFAPFQQVVPVTAITWGFEGQSPDVFVRGFPASEQQFIAFNNFFGVRLFKGPPLSGTVAQATLTGVDAQSLLIGKDTQPDISGIDAQALLTAKKSNSDLQASVDIDNSVALPLPSGENYRVTEDGETRITEDGEIRIIE